ncbi:hypothetical protein TNIN_281861 [Trichonephila inaurata madagascariensis]|uniref:Uncharacterized protein n=1 Tax=Trichonephila inaurata madagascariensis TaxID=2747483 RepID=A0A8X6X6Z0_9ARAC|nr:hypothetical protein TNIN_281861 [Trichonephila inaurata madagascariensis]
MPLALYRVIQVTRNSERRSQRLPDSDSAYGRTDVAGRRPSDIRQDRCNPMHLNEFGFDLLLMEPSSLSKCVCNLTLQTSLQLLNRAYKISVACAIGGWN